MDRAQPDDNSLSELHHLCERLSADQRDDLLHCLLTVAPRGGEAMIKVIEEMLLCHATAELLDEHSSGRP
jgi:hypothetical protein